MLMDGREATPKADPSISSPRSPFQERRTKSREVDLEEPNKRAKRVKLRDLETVMRSEEGIRSSSLNRKEEGNEELENSSEEVGTSQITKAADLRLSSNPVDMPTNNSSLETDAAVLRLGHAINLQSSMVTAGEFEAENTKGTCRASLPTKDEMKNDSQTADLLSFGVDLNNPFYPYKKLGQVRATDASECGSTTGPLENNESMRRWNEMKQNGFVSSLKEIAPIPKPRDRQPRRKKVEDTKKKGNTAKGELANKYTKVAAPSGLLSGLNPGIIKHVRNSKQVNSIIEAMLQNEKLEKKELRHRPLEQSRNGGRGVNVGENEHRHAPVADKLDLSLNKAFDPACFGSRVQNSESDTPDDKFNNDSSNASLYNSEFDDDVLTLKLSSDVMSTEHARSAAIIDFSINQENTTSLSFKAASVASQWLGLIQQDIKGRLAALRRSKKRVKNAVQIELPFLLSSDLAPQQENESMLLHSSLLQCPRKETLDMHMARWKNLFGQMEKSLLEEGKHLERWLRQVEELQSQCEKGLKYVGANGLSNFDSKEDASVWKNKESWERECAVRAAAASIYSTSNLIMTAR